MRWHEKRTSLMLARAAVVLLLVAFVSLACTGSSDDQPADAAVDPEPSASPTLPPSTATSVPATATSVPELSNEARLDAARDALDAQGARDLIAWDVLEASLDGDLVTFQLCGWTGVDAFDAVYRSNWSVSVGPDGEPAAVEVGTSVDAGECLNTELIDSAFDFLAEYEAYRYEMLRYPDRFPGDARALALMTSNRIGDAEVFLRRMVEEESYVDFAGDLGHPADVAATELIYRRYRIDGRPILELAFCRDLDPRYGSYRDGVLFDDAKPENGEIGPHHAGAYQLVRSSSGDRWLYESLESLVWADCFGLAGDWVAGANNWLQGPVAFEVAP